MGEFKFYLPQIDLMLDAGNVQLSTIKPSQWAEENIIMPKPRPGALRYRNSPYAKEIIDRLSPDDPCRKLYVMKGAQIGISSTVIIPFLVYMIRNCPGNTYFMVGAPDLVAKAVERLDLAIDSTATRAYIKPQAIRNRNNQSGDTNFKKDFAGGYIFTGATNNHKAIAQVDLQYTILDDLDAMKSVSKEDGSLVSLVLQRHAAYRDTYKHVGISTPRLKSASVIEPLS